MGPIKSWMCAGFDTNQSKEHKMHLSSNWNYEKDYHCAWKLVLDDKFKLTEAYGALLFNNTGNGNWYFRSNCLKKIMALGCNYTVKDGLAHSTEF